MAGGFCGFILGHCELYGNKPACDLIKAPQCRRIRDENLLAAEKQQSQEGSNEKD